MKLRVLDNSIRLRLTQSEVETVSAEGLVRGRVRFAGSNTFDYILESSPATVRPEAQISNNVLTGRVPKMDVAQWAHPDRISNEAEQVLEDRERLTSLVEKDFHGLTPRDGEDDSDMYPHPEAGSRTC